MFWYNARNYVASLLQHFLCPWNQRRFTRLHILWFLFFWLLWLKKGRKVHCKKLILLLEHITQIKEVFHMQNNQDKANQMEQMSYVKTVFLPWPLLSSKRFIDDSLFVWLLYIKSQRSLKYSFNNQIMYLDGSFPFWSLFTIELSWSLKLKDWYSMLLYFHIFLFFLKILYKNIFPHLLISESFAIEDSAPGDETGNSTFTSIISP